MSNTLARAGSAFQRRPAQDAGTLALQKRKLEEQLAEADPKDVGKVYARELPAFGANYFLSAADHTETGKAFEDAVKVKPSTAVLVISTLIAFLSPRRWRTARAAATKVGKGGAHAVLARLGQQTPDALAGHHPTTTSGVDDEPTGGSQPERDEQI